MKPLVHYKPVYDTKFACGLEHGKSTNRVDGGITCLGCANAMKRQSAAYTKEGSYAQADEKVGTAKIAKESYLKKLAKLMLEAEEEDAKEEETEKLPGEDSLDSQVDKYLAEYESEAKHAKNEGLNFKMVARRIMNEAGKEAAAEEEKKEDTSATDKEDEEPSKMTEEDIDIASFTSSVMRLVENYDSLLEVNNTILRRASNFLAKNYEKEVIDAFNENLLESYGLEIGKSKSDMEDENPAPRAGDAGPAGAGGGGGV